VKTKNVQQKCSKELLDSASQPTGKVRSKKQPRKHKTSRSLKLNNKPKKANSTPKPGSAGFDDFVQKINKDGKVGSSVCLVCRKKFNIPEYEIIPPNIATDQCGKYLTYSTKVTTRKARPSTKVKANNVFRAPARKPASRPKVTTKLPRFTSVPRPSIILPGVLGNTEGRKGQFLVETTTAKANKVQDKTTLQHRSTTISTKSAFTSTLARKTGPTGKNGRKLNCRLRYPPKTTTRPPSSTSNSASSSSTQSSSRGQSQSEQATKEGTTTQVATTTMAKPLNKKQIQSETVKPSSGSKQSANSTADGTSTSAPVHRLRDKATTVKKVKGSDGHRGSRKTNPLKHPLESLRDQEPELYYFN
jgi:hypothetical protein